MFRSLPFLIGVLAMFAPLLAAEPGPAPPDGRAGFLFLYQPHRDEVPRFEAGYRKHLEWHQQKKDGLVWYGWSVVFGERLGLFIDGTFGNRFAAMDERVDPRGDRADFAATAGPHAQPVARRALELLPELSTGWLLEQQQPSAMIEVIHYKIRPGRAELFEQIVARVADALRKQDEGPMLTTYRLVTGGDEPAYILMVPLARWGDYDRSTMSLEALVAGLAPSGESSTRLESLTLSVSGARSEIWRYRRDLSYFPSAE